MDLRSYFETTFPHYWFNTALIALVASYTTPARTIVEGVLLALAVVAFVGAVVSYPNQTWPDEEVADRG